MENNEPNCRLDRRNRFECFRIKKIELKRELVTGYAFRRYEQFETSPEAIEQELRPAVCEHRQIYVEL